MSYLELKKHKTGNRETHHMGKTHFQKETPNSLNLTATA